MQVNKERSHCRKGGTPFAGLYGLRPVRSNRNLKKDFGLTSSLEPRASGVMRRMVLIGLLVVAATAAGVWWWLTHHERAPQELILYGNVDLRQVQLAFNNSERIAT